LTKIDPTRAWKFFFHPDFTVGAGISPARHRLVFADFTAGVELHHASKKSDYEILRKEYGRKFILPPIPLLHYFNVS